MSHFDNKVISRGFNDTFRHKTEQIYQFQEPQKDSLIQGYWKYPNWSNSQNKTFQPFSKEYLDKSLPTSEQKTINKPGDYHFSEIRHLSVLFI